MADAEKIEYEAPSAEERADMDREQEEKKLYTLEEMRERIQRVVDARDRIDEREKAAEVRRQQTRRETALHLAVAWTADSAKSTVDEPGTLFGLADLMIQYIETGKKPTETEAARASKPYRR